MSPERLALLKQNAPNYDDYDARVDVAELVAEVERVKGQLDVVVALVYAMGSMELIQHVAPVAYPDEEAENVFYAKYAERFMIPDPPTST